MVKPCVVCVCDLCAYYGEFPRDVFARCVRANLDSTRVYDCHYYYFTILNGFICVRKGCFLSGLLSFGASDTLFLLCVFLLHM